MSKRRLVITAVLTGLSQSEVARTYGVSQGWISRLMARYRHEGEAAFEPRSRRPHSVPNAIPLGEVGGFPIDVASRTSLGQVHIVAELRGVPGASVTVPRDQFSEAGVGLVRQLENRAASVPKLIAETQQKRVEAETIITEVDARIGDPFKHSAELHEAQARQAHVLADLAAMANDQNPRAETPNDSVPGGTDDQTATRDRVKKLAERARARADGEGRDEARDHSLDIRPGRPRV